MSNVALTGSHERWTWLCDSRFDLFFIAGIPAIAFLVGAVVVFQPQLFLPILFVDLWLLGYHHVIATYTRICFDRKSFSEHGNLLLVLLPAVVVATLAVAYLFGLWTVVSVYFYWQWFHYARQSWGVSRAYRARQRTALYEQSWLDQAIFYALPVLGILYRSYQDPGVFIGMELRVIPVAGTVIVFASIATVTLLAMWIVHRLRAWREDRLAIVHSLYMLSHFAVFAVAYLLIRDITYGWLVINIWHNLQYILFVWLFNTRRFKSGIDPDAYFLSYISQPGRLWAYLGSCVIITGVVYLAILQTLDYLLFASLSATIVLYQIVNFHHYVVDSRIWKVRQTSVRKTLGLQD